MKLRSEISNRERFLSILCAICDEAAYGRIDGFGYSSMVTNDPLYCEYCMNNWDVSNRDGNLQIGREEPHEN